MIKRVRLIVARNSHDLACWRCAMVIALRKESSASLVGASATKRSSQVLRISWTALFTGISVLAHLMVMTYSAPPFCSANHRPYSGSDRSWAVQGDDFAISSVPNPCGGAYAVGPGHAADAQFVPRVLSQRQHHVGALDTTEFIQSGARTVAQSGAALPLLQGFPVKSVRQVDITPHSTKRPPGRGLGIGQVGPLVHHGRSRLAQWPRLCRQNWLPLSPYKAVFRFIFVLLSWWAWRCGYRAGGC
jgi:hypothetical protein